MDRLLLDTNAYRHIADRPDVHATLRDLIQAGSIEVLLTPTVRDQLRAHPDGIPAWFPLREIPEAAFIVGHVRVGEFRIGSGEVYTAHKGDSQQIADAMIAEAAHTDATIFVSDDNRCRDRLRSQSTTCQAFTVPEFIAWVLAH